jgi:hypothetical protein
MMRRGFQQRTAVEASWRLRMLLAMPAPIRYRVSA